MLKWAYVKKDGDMERKYGLNVVLRRLRAV
jgi:hypothetical protein